MHASRSRVICTSILALPLLWIQTAEAGGPKLKIHAHGIVRHSIDLTGGPNGGPAERGTITYRLQTGTLSPSGRTVYFVISDASSKDFVETYGGIRADALADAHPDAIEDADFDEATGEWTFYEDPGFTARDDGLGGVIAPVGNPDYSPLKRISYDGEDIIVNVPFIKWGDEAGQRLIADDANGCNQLFRNNPPSPFMIPNGPPGCTASETPIERYKGGQVLSIDTANLEVTMKLHTSFNAENKLTLYTVFETNKGPASGFMGNILATKLGNLERYEETDSVANIIQFANGKFTQAGGPNRFQAGLSQYAGGQSGTYSPMWGITWVFFDTNENGVFYRDDRNVSRGATPVPGSGIPGFDPASPATFDPFQMDDKGVHNPSYVASVNPNGTDRIEDYDDVEDLEDSGALITTEGPPGLERNSSMQPHLLVSCPVPMTIRL